MKICMCVLIILSSIQVWAQNLDSIEFQRIKKENEILKYTELVQSMSQRSLLTPSYFKELKALIAKQAYNFWSRNEGETYVSHLNVYSALYYANKYLGYDSINQRSYNQALGHTESVVSIQCSKDPDVFYSAGSDGKVLAWSLKEIKSIPEIIYQGDHLIRSIDVNEDGSWILVVTKNEGVILIPKSDNKETSPEVIRDTEPVQTAVFISGKNQYLTVGKNGKLTIKGFQKSELIGESAEKIKSLAVNSENQQIYAGTETGNITIWTDRLEVELYFKEAFAVNALAISPDNNLLALGREKGDIILWDLQKKELFRIISGHQSAITDVDFSPDGKLLLSASRDKTVRIWDVQDARKFPIILDDHDDWVLSASFDMTGEKIITGSKDNFIRVWPVSPEPLARRICELIPRNLTLEEWEEYIGTRIPYEETCFSENN